MPTSTTSELDDVRDEIDALRAELGRIAKNVGLKNGTARTTAAGGLTRQAAQMATNFAVDFAIRRGRWLRGPVERAISAHPFGAAAVALAGLVMFGRYMLRPPD